MNASLQFLDHLRRDALMSDKVRSSVHDAMADRAWFTLRKLRKPGSPAIQRVALRR